MRIHPKERVLFARIDETLASYEDFVAKDHELALQGTQLAIEKREAELYGEPNQ